MPLRTRRDASALRRSAAVLAATLLLTACGGGGDGADDDAPEPAATSNGQDEPDEVEATDEPTEDPEPEEPEIDPAEIGANELGEIPVLMYHRILPDGGGEYDNTPEEFREELRRLHEAGYVPITAADLASGSIDVPAGTTPVVLTFDDSTREQFALDEDGEVEPETAVGIMEELAEELDGFEPTGSFYVLSSLFGVAQERGYELLADLAERGYELGNHTAQHENLRQLDAAGVQRALVEGIENIRAAVPDAEVRTLSYPLGIRPDDPALGEGGRHGESLPPHLPLRQKHPPHGDVSYVHEGGLLVGSGPSPSPFDAEFDPLAIPRIRSQPNWSAGDEPDYGSGFWLTWFEDNPERRYISDGDPDTISFPEELEDQLTPDLEDRARPY